LDDVIYFVLNEMHKFGKTLSPDDTYEDDEVESSLGPSHNDDEVSDDWIFPGFMAFILWGPFVKQSDRFITFQNDDCGKKKVKKQS